MSEPRSFDGWTSVFTSSTDYEADLVRDRLDASGISAVVLTQRDHAFNLTVGDMSGVHVMVQDADLARARDVLGEVPLTDEELEAAAMAADPGAHDAHNADLEDKLDSGMESLDFGVPDDDTE
jgi:hypothetical protein